MQRTKEFLVQQILKLSEEIFSAFTPNIPVERLSSEITVAQLRVLLILQAEGSSRMSSIASGLDIALSTATGIVDNLVKKRLVTRQDDPQDRRLVIIKLSKAGQKIINRLWISGQFQMEKLLDGLTLEQLQEASDVAQMLFNNALRRTSNVDRNGIK